MEINFLGTWCDSHGEFNHSSYQEKKKINKQQDVRSRVSISSPIIC